MTFPSGSASLHSGLIHRVRPHRPAGAEPVIRAVPVPAGRSAAAATGFGRAGAVRDRAPAPDPERRFGLTVRVGWRMRSILLRIRARTGRTTQSILHDALLHYVSVLDGEGRTR